MSTMHEVTPADLRLLDLETAWIGRAQSDGRKARAIREQLDLSETEYYQRLSALLQVPDLWSGKYFRTLDVVARRQRRSMRQRSAATDPGDPSGR